jgi:hypothetical protein
LPQDLCEIILKDFLKNSWSAIKALTQTASGAKFEKTKQATFFTYKNNQKTLQTFGREHFFLRGSVEYTNPQLTVEEIQGIIGARLLQVCGNYFMDKETNQPETNDVNQLCELLKKPPAGKIIAFLLNTDDVEADRYSMNPLRESIVKSGQSAFPAANVKTKDLKVDQKFADKYEDTLICKDEVELIRNQLEISKDSYMDFVDSVKYAHITSLSEIFGMDLSLPSMRMPLTTLQSENKDGLLHHIISDIHRDFESVKQAYECMGRSMTKRTTLLTIPHSVKGYGSKRAARGRIYFNQNKLESANVKYKDTLLYPNAIDPQDISVAKCEDNFTITADKLNNYSFTDTPSSPQFFLYSLGSPEDAALWHGIGAFASSQLLHSYSNIRVACRTGKLMGNLQEKYGARTDVPLQLNLAPEGIWVHPIHRNIDASIGCVRKIEAMAIMGMKIEHLSNLR